MIVVRVGKAVVIVTTGARTGVAAASGAMGATRGVAAAGVATGAVAALAVEVGAETVSLKPVRAVVTAAPETGEAAAVVSGSSSAVSSPYVSATERMSWFSAQF